MKTYKVLTGQHGNWWWIEIPDLDGGAGFSQADSYAEVEAMARDAISLLTEVPEDSFGIDIQLQEPASRD